MRPEASSALIICKVLSRLLFKTKRKVLLPRTLYLDAREGPNGAGDRTLPYATAPQLWSRPVAPPSLIVAVPMTCGVCKKRVLERCVFDIVTFWWWAQPALYVIGASGPSGGARGTPSCPTTFRRCAREIKEIEELPGDE